MGLAEDVDRAGEGRWGTSAQIQRFGGQPDGVDADQRRRTDLQPAGAISGCRDGTAARGLRFKLVVVGFTGTRSLQTQPRPLATDVWAVVSTTATAPSLAIRSSSASEDAAQLLLARREL
jgi:hypothetical protein